MIRKRASLQGLLICVVLLFSLQDHIFANAQISRLTPSNLQDTGITFENVYLHTDRDLYAAGENIWYKAYLIDFQKHQLTNHSNNLYVELISQTNSVVSQQMIRLNNGLGNGDFKLDTALRSGNYRLRAYTRWMRNFKDAFVFQKNIHIEPVYSKSSVVAHSSPSSRNAEFSPPNAGNNLAQLSIGIYPEGGCLLYGITSKVAVKAEDGVGAGVALNAAVVSFKGDTITKFKCDSLGFGQFSLTAQTGERYKIITLWPKTAREFNVPAALATGLAISVQKINQNYLIKINTATTVLPGQNRQQLQLVITHADLAQYQQQVTLAGNFAQLTVPESELPAGINCVTIYDEAQRPHCQRLIYVEHPGSANFSFAVGKQTYQKDEKANVELQLKSMDGQPLIGNFSIAVVNGNIASAGNSSIVSYFNLQSEVKGDVADAGRYFDNANKNRAQQMDLLLLTQGWRNYLWRQLVDSLPVITHQAEHDITLTGRVRGIYRKKGYAGLNISVFANKASGQKLFAARTDSLGYFKIPGLFFYGYQMLNVTSVDDKGKLQGWIQVDSIKHTPAPILPYFQTNTSSLNYSNAIAKFKQQQANADQSLGIKLKAVEVKETRSRYIPYTEVIRVTQQEHKDYRSLMQYLLFNIDGLQTDTVTPKRCGGPPAEQIPTLRLKVSGWGASFSISGTYLDKSPLPECTLGLDFLTLPMTSIVNLTIKRKTHTPGAIVIVEAKPGSLEQMGLFSKTVADVVGYYNAREFYSTVSKPASTSVSNNSTILWQPYLTTDGLGKANITYTNPSGIKNLRIIIQGVTKNGGPVYLNNSL